MHTFQEVVEHFGGITPLASELGVTTQAISQWDEKFPEGRAYQIEVLTKGHFKASCLPTRKASLRNHKVA